MTHKLQLCSDVKKICYSILPTYRINMLCPPQSGPVASCPCQPTTLMCNGVSYDKDAKKNFEADGNREARPSNLGCYCCGEFGHARRECTVDPGTLLCPICKDSGHVAEVCPETHTFLKYARSRSTSLNCPRRPSADEAKTRLPYPQNQKTGYPRTNQRSTKPGPMTRILPRAGYTTALLAFHTRSL